MRKFIVAATLAAAAGPALAQGQTQITAKQRMQDTTVRLTMGPLSPDQLRMLAEKMSALIVRNKKLDAKLVQGIKEKSLSREESESLQDEMDRVFGEILTTQRQLAFGCLQRPKTELVDGTLGLHVHDTVSILRTVDAQGGTLTMVFKTTPRIVSVDPGSPAEKAGIQVGDMWVSANGRPLIDTVRFDELLKPGSPVNVHVMRGGKDVEITGMTVVKKPTDGQSEACANVKDFFFSAPFTEQRGDGRSGIIAVSPPRKIGDRPPLPAFPGGGNIQFFMVTPNMVQFGGAVMQPLDDDWRDSGGLQGDGLLITELTQGSPAEALGLHKGEVIRLVNGEPVATTAAFRIAIQPMGALKFTIFNKKTGTRTVVFPGRR